jgi:hypothetical protein
MLFERSDGALDDLFMSFRRSHDDFELILGPELRSDGIDGGFSVIAR